MGAYKEREDEQERRGLGGFLRKLTNVVQQAGPPPTKHVAKSTTKAVNSWYLTLYRTHFGLTVRTKSFSWVNELCSEYGSEYTLALPSTQGFFPLHASAVAA